MGLFSSKDDGWAEEYEARLNDPSVKKDTMRGGVFRALVGRTDGLSEVRVEDDAGTMRRPNGDGCCGCGRFTGPSDSRAPVVTDPRAGHHHDEDPEEPPKMFLRIF